MTWYISSSTSCILWFLFTYNLGYKSFNYGVKDIAVCNIRLIRHKKDMKASGARISKERSRPLLLTLRGFDLAKNFITIDESFRLFDKQIIGSCLVLSACFLVDSCSFWKQPFNYLDKIIRNYGNWMDCRSINFLFLSSTL